jgi:hypothetical protein
METTPVAHCLVRSICLLVFILPFSEGFQNADDKDGRFCAQYRCCMSQGRRNIELDYSDIGT